MTQLQSQAATKRPKPPKPLFEVVDLAVSFDIQDGEVVNAVNGVSMAIHPRQTVAVVGESGCGKSVTAMSSMQLIPRPPGRFDRGQINYQGRNLLALTEKQMLHVRGKEIAMIFQEPMTSLNPVYSIGDQIMEAILLHQNVSEQEAMEIAIESMAAVGIPKPKERLLAYPHQFSGGMRQRVMIAMALACQPKLLLADEPTTALDVTIQAQILELLRALQRDRSMGMMLITHDLGVVAENADVVCVMYAGRVVEYANVYDLFERSFHPYTRGLFQSIPNLRDQKRRLTTIDQVIGNPEEFRKLPGHEHGVTPWWPGMTPPKDLVPTSEGEDYMLYEIEPDHWVGCWRTEWLLDHPTRRPNLDFRKDDLADE